MTTPYLIYPKKRNEKIHILFTLRKEMKKEEDKIEDQHACKEHPNLSICHFLFFRKSCTPISPMVTNAMKKVINKCTYSTLANMVV